MKLVNIGFGNLINADRVITILSPESAPVKKIIKEIKDIDAKVDNSTDYYNDNITTYNTLIKKFPSNIVAMLCKYKEKLFFDRKDMSDEDYDDFKL